ncbi:MAG: hypothetical protein V7K68_02145 [Nostoc sp.]
MSQEEINQFYEAALELIRKIPKTELSNLNFHKICLEIEVLAIN